MGEIAGYIYILTNPSFEEYVKIGYADDVKQRLEQLNRSECTPFAFRVYATYAVSDRLSDLTVHSIIDRINPSLRSIDNVDGKIRKREFYAMTPEDAYMILEDIAKLSGSTDRLKLWKQTEEEKQDEVVAKTITEELAINRHHFKDIEFSSSLTGKKYKGTTGEDGTLCIIDLENNEIVQNNSKPSKREIIGYALGDLGEEVLSKETLYQRYARLAKLLLN